MFTLNKQMVLLMVLNVFKSPRISAGASNFSAKNKQGVLRRGAEGQFALYIAGF